MNSLEFRDPERCKKCGGKCCLIYLATEDGGMRSSQEWFEDWVRMWDEQFIESGADHVPPFYDPLIIHQNNHEHLRNELKAQGFDPDKCKYCGKEGCILDWEHRPKMCKEFRCKEWKIEDKIKIKAAFAVKNISK